MEPVKKIQDILSNISENSKNKSDAIFINAVKNEFITLKGEINIPKIPVKELEYDIAVEIVKSMAEFIPEFLSGHRILEKKTPPSDQHFLQFVKRYKGVCIDFIHMFKADFLFGGDSSTVIEKGDSDYYPSYRTNRFYYKSRLIPVKKTEEENISSIDSLRLFDSVHVESDHYMHTFVVFEDLNVKELTEKLLNVIDKNIYNISTGLYPFIVYDYFTACFNVLNPVGVEISKAIEIFEPLFLYIYSQYKEINTLMTSDIISEKIPDALSAENGSLNIKDEFLMVLRKYFKKFTLYRDDDLALKGWWKINIENS